MGPKDLERHVETKERHEEEQAIKKGRGALASNFEKLKAEKFGQKEDMKDEAMLEWVELNKQLHIDRNTGKPYHITSAEKTKAIFLENPMVPIGNIA